MARFEDIFSEDDDIDLDDVVDDDDESQEQRTLDKAKKLKEKNVAKQVEMNLCMNIFLQRCVCIAVARRVFLIVYSP